MEVSYVLAGYNEESQIGEVIEKIVDSLERDFDDYELILVNDGSKDNTGVIMEQYAKDNDKIKVLQNIVNLNFGTSVLRGLKYASKEWVIYNAVDLPLLPEQTIEMIKKAQRYDVLVLERTEYKCVAWRKLTSKVNLLMLNILYPKLMKGTPVVNYIQIFNKNAVDKCIPFARSPIFVWPEMIFRAKLAGLKVGNVQHTPYVPKVNKGSFGKPHDIMWGVYEMLRFRIRLWKKTI